MKFLDTVQIDPESRAAAGSLLVKADADYLADHFPGAPMLPGLLMLEAAVRTAAQLWTTTEPARRAPVLEHLERLQVVRRVVPGETLVVRVELSRDRAAAAGAANFTADGAVNGQTAVRARFRLRAVEEAET